MVFPRTVPHQAQIGLGLTAAIVVGWIALHVWSVFFLTIGSTTWPLVPAIMLVQCWLSVGMFIAAHDAMHGSLAPGHARTNAVVGGGVLALYAGFGWRQMRDAHMDHHQHSGTEGDPDFDAAHPSAFWPWYATFLRRYFGWRSMLYVVTVVGVYAVVLRAAPANILLFYGIPAIGSSLQLFYFGTYRPHRHDTDGFADTHHARTSGFGPIVSLATCFHFGYHHEHHLSPYVPWWRLPARYRAGLVANEILGDVEAGLRA
ncbi:fatty acid desaturase [Sphingomonas montana]|uniref:fatty acid desaturase n=1 Tax=Sphingomonas montana TaxID=1843236 RepID=UPI00096EBD17|nr:fatty acid desaturase [Sphingomonas montana]